jgi:hypothetical protein
VLDEQDMPRSAIAATVTVPRERVDIIRPFAGSGSGIALIGSMNTTVASSLFLSRKSALARLAVPRACRLGLK